MKNLIIKSYNIDFFFYLSFFLFLFLIIKYYSSLDKTFIKISLVFIRTISLIIILLFLLNPIFNFQIEEYNSREIDIYVDNSKSIELGIENDKEAVELFYQDINKWSNKNDIFLNYFVFNDTVSSILDIQNITYNRHTDFSNLFKNINTNTFNALNKEIVIVSDGVNNLGLQNYNNSTQYNIHTVGVGSIKNQFDIDIKNINYLVSDTNEITLDIKFDINGINSKLSKTIYLSNEKHLSLPIGQATFFDENYKNIILKIDKKHISRNNLISLDVDDAETNKENNSYLLKIDSNIINDKILLLISNRLSPNTKSINHIINQIPNVQVNHIFKIFDSWNKPFNDIDFDNYDYIIFDDISSNDISFFNISNMNNKKIIIFTSNEEEILNIMTDNNCDKLNQKILYANDIKIEYMNDEILLPPIDYDVIYKCNENAFNLNPFFYYLNSDKILINIKNLYEYNALSMQSSIDNNLFKFVEEIIENEIYDRSKTIDIYTKKENYNENKEINIFYNINDTLMNNKNHYIEISDREGSIIKIDNYDLITNELLQFSFTPIHSGYYNILGFIQHNNNKEASNEIVINVSEDDIEISNIYLDEDYLTNIAENNNGNYVHIDNTDQFFEKLNTDKIYSNKDIHRDILSYQYLLIILIFLLISEWYIRNKIGLP